MSFYSYCEKVYFNYLLILKLVDVFKYLYTWFRITFFQAAQISIWMDFYLVLIFTHCAHFKLQYVCTSIIFLLTRQMSMWIDIFFHIMELRRFKSQNDWSFDIFLILTKSGQSKYQNNRNLSFYFLSYFRRSKF